MLYITKAQYEDKANGDQQQADNLALQNFSAWLANKSIGDKKASEQERAWLEREIAQFLKQLIDSQEKRNLVLSLAALVGVKNYDKLLTSTHPSGKFVNSLLETFTAFYADRQSYSGGLILHPAVDKLQQQLPSTLATLHVMLTPARTKLTVAEKDFMLDSIKRVCTELEKPTEKNPSVEDTAFKLFAAQHQAITLQQESKRSDSPEMQTTTQVLQRLASVREVLTQQSQSTMALVRQSLSLPVTPVAQHTPNQAEQKAYEVLQQANSNENKNATVETKDQARAKATLTSMYRTMMLQASAPTAFNNGDEELAWLLQAEEMKAYSVERQAKAEQEANDAKIAQAEQAEEDARSRVTQRR